MASKQSMGRRPRREAAPVIERWEVISEQCRDFAAAPIKKEAVSFAKIIGLQNSTSQFEEEIATAIEYFILAPSLKKISTLRKQVLQVEKAAASAARKIGELKSAFYKLSSVERWSITTDLPKPFVESAFECADSFYLLSNAARRSRLDFTTRGGRPGHASFQALVLALSILFERVVGRPAKATWSEAEGRYKGKFVDFVEAVLPLALDCAKHFNVDARYPKTPLGRGKIIFRNTRTARVPRR
jgi:hypothetical protein